MRINSSVACIPRQRHYFHCLYNSHSVGAPSRVHGSTTRQAYVSSRIMRQCQRSLLSFLPKGYYGIITVDQYSSPNKALGVLLQHIVLHSVYILYVLLCVLVIRSYLWYTLFIWCGFLFIRIFVFLLCLYCYIILLKIVLLIQHTFPIIRLLFSCAY